MTGVTVAIAVGPHQHNTRWLEECVQSVEAQTRKPEELLLIDDSGRWDSGLLQWAVDNHHTSRVWENAWNLGVAHSYNVAVGLSRTPLVFMLGSDDTLEPTCLEKCLEAYEAARDDRAYYYVSVKYMDTGEVQTVPCHAAMVSRGLWKHLGGFPLQSASGAPDAAIISIMFRHGGKAGRLRPVQSGVPLYNYRRHAETDTARKGAWQGVILETRDLVTREWVARP